MSQTAITKKLVSLGQKQFDSPAKFHEFTKNAKADQLLNDLKRFPHAFVLGCIMDRQMKAERAWIIPYLFAQKLGDFSFETLASLTLAKVTRIMTKPNSLHRFPIDMSKAFHFAVQLIGERWGGDASRIWANTPSSALVVHRFLQFRGAGPKIATMAANLLAREFKIPFSDYYSIDISVDVQVRRVFTRLGLIKTKESVESIVYLARAMNPEFPGVLDSPAWEIGRKWCFPHKPNCDDCPMSKVCTFREAAQA